MLAKAEVSSLEFPKYKDFTIEKLLEEIPPDDKVRTYLPDPNS